MRRIHTILALAAATQAMAAGNIGLAINIRDTSKNHFSASPYFMPTRSQRVKNKIRLRQKNS